MFNAKQHKRPVNFIAQMIIIYYVVAPFLYLLRTLVGDTGFVAIALRSSEPSLTIATFTLCVLQDKFKLNNHSLILILIGTYGLLVAVLQENSLGDWMGGYLHFMTGVILFIYFYGPNHDLDTDTFMQRLSWYTLVSYSIVLAIMYSLPLLGLHVYLGLACQIFIVVLFYTLQKRQFYLSLWALLLVILSGKRGVFIAFFITSSISLFFLLKQLSFAKKIKVLSLIVLVGSLLIGVLPFLNEKLVSKYTYNEKETVDDYSAGRWNEMLSATTQRLVELENLVVGSGFGFTYTYVHSLADIGNIDNYKNIHFSYLNPIIIFGLPVCFIYYGFLMILFTKLFRQANPYRMYMKWSSLAYLIYACFVFNLFDEPIFWMLNGMLFHPYQNIEKKPQVYLRSHSAAIKI